MKFLSIATPGHDHNVTFFDGKKIRYIKFERLKRIKRFGFEHIWEVEYEINKTWGIHFEDCDEIALIYNSMLNINNTNYSDRLLVDSQIEHVFKDVLNKTSYVGHHYAHALSTYFLTDSKPSFCFVIDGLGDDRPWSVFKNEQLVGFGDKENGSIGWGMKDMGRFLGLEAANPIDLAGKVMGIQSYGKLDYQYLEIINKFSFKEINKIFSVNLWVEYKKDNFVAKNTLLDWARTVNERVGNLLVEMFSSFANKQDVITYSGGVAQNVVWNTLLKENFPNLTVVPHSADEGLSFGGMYWLLRKHNLNVDLDGFPYLQNDVSPITKPTNETIKETAKLLALGKVVAWYQDNGEVGPRALGNRSILMDAKQPNGKEKINKIKRRENYRPFGASVLKEHKNLFFDSKFDDPYMLYTSKINSDLFPAITHVDGTCRVQTVDDKNKNFKLLLEEFYKLTGYSLVLNTSLNLAGKPIAGFPEDAVELFNFSELDALVIGDQMYKK